MKRTFAAIVAIVLTTAGAWAQKPSIPDLAAKLSGTWVLNRQLSTGFSAPGRRGGFSDLQPRFAATAPLVQRGGRGGGGSSPTDPADLTPQQRAEQAAMRQLQQLADRVTITASADTVNFTDVRGERSYAVNDKSSKIDVGGSMVNVKSKWDKTVLKQEFSNTQAKLIETWGLDGEGHLVLTAKIESMTLLTPEQRAVFDRQ